MKVKAILLILTGLLTLTACGGNGVPPDVQAAPRLTVATSFYPIYIMTINIAKDVPGVRVVNVSPPVTGCLHDYQLNSADLRILAEAQVFVINGAGMESFLDKVIGQQPDLLLIDSSEGIPLLQTDSDGKPNPHLWVSVSDNILQVKNIGEGLAELDPAYASLYRANAEAYAERLADLRTRMHEGLDDLPNRDIITFHEAFPYLAEEFNLNNLTVIQREPGTEPSPAELAKTIELVQNSPVKALFAEPQYDSQAADIIARETGLEVFILDPAATGPMDPDAYIQIMEENQKTLMKALK